jgi:hemolysin activation/secretion protein
VNKFTVISAIACKPLRILLTGLLIIGHPLISFAQTDKPVIDQQSQDSAIITPGKTAPAAIDNAQTPVLDLGENADQIVAEIKTIRFSGNSVLGNDHLAPIAVPFENTQMTRGDLIRLKYELTRAYYNQGYVLVRVLTPPQDLSDGILNVHIVEARIGAMHLEFAGLDESLASHYAQRIPVGEVFQESVVESAVSDINDMAGVKSRILLKPGKETGTTDVHLKIEPDDDAKHAFSLDNSGSDFTGAVNANLHLAGHNALGRGEKFGLHLRKSVGGKNEDLTRISVDMKMPLAWSNWHLESQLLWSENEIGDRLVALNSTGESQQLGLALSRTLVNTLAHQSKIRVGLESRKHESTLAGVNESSDSISQVFVEADGVWRYGSRWVVYASARLLQGVNWLGADEIGESDATRAQGDPEALIFRPTFFTSFHPASKDSISLTLQAQSTDDVLLSSDLFAIGGEGSVRGFEPGAEFAEDGYQLSVQYNRKFSAGGRTLTASVFYDLGHVNGKLANTIQDDTLKSVGLGMNMKLPKMDSRISLQVGFPTGTYTDKTLEDQVFYARFSRQF